MENILYTESEIQENIKNLAIQIEDYYKDRDWIALIVYNGAIFFATDLLRNINGNYKVAGIQVSSYKGGFTSGELNITGDIDCKDKHVLIIDDIYDTGKTLHALSNHLRDKGATTVECCVLLNKDIPKSYPVDVLFKCFTVPNKFVYGYGLDVNNRFRNLKHIAVYEPQLP